MEITAHSLPRRPERISAARIKRSILLVGLKSIELLNQVKTLGITRTMEEYEQRKLSIFNQLNFFQLLTGILVPIAGLFNNKQLPAGFWIVACLPAMVSIVVLFLNKKNTKLLFIVISSSTLLLPV